MHKQHTITALSRATVLSTLLLGCLSTPALSSTIGGNPLYWTITTLVDDHGNLANGPLLNTSSTSQSDAVTGANTETLSAAVNIATGRLSAFSSVSGTNSPFGVANASYADTLTFTGTFANLVVPFSLSASGTWSDTAGATDIGSLYFYAAAPGAIDPNNVFNNTPLANQSMTLTSGTTFPATVSGTITLNGTNPGFTFLTHLNVGSAYTGTGATTADFAHTATLSFTLPTGVAVQSASGVFPGTTSGVPEPGTLGLLAAGFMAIGLRLRKVRPERKDEYPLTRAREDVSNSFR